jgi:ADP-ribose pyrophosphatase YjhB (NUDIX family)
VSNNSDTWKPHVTVAAIAEKAGRFLLVKEKVDGREVFNQPAGHVEPNESVEQAVIRETLEETSYAFKPLRLCGIYRFTPDPHNNRTYLRFAFSGEIGEHLKQPLDTDILSAEWMTLDEIRQTRHAHRSPMVMQCVLDYLEKPSYPLQVFSSSFA